MNNLNLENKTIYEVYVRSFKDSNNDGIGDLVGIINKLDYLEYLGVDYIWITPIFKTPNKDYGYDVSDYYSINPEFGSLNDLKLLIEEAKLRNIGILLDLVLNHTSNMHPWFLDFVNNPNSKYKDYYIVKDYKLGLPNNMKCQFGDSAWHRAGDYYYLGIFSEFQPDLNWRNKELREELYEIMKYYLKLGIKGFRLDVITLISKPKVFKDIENKIPDFKSYAGSRGLFKYYQEMREKIDMFEPFLIGECSGIPLNKSKPYAKYIELMLNFDLFNIDGGETFKWNDKPFLFSKAVKAIIKQQKYLSEYNIPLFLENHDQPRISSRLSNFKNNELFIKSTCCFAGWFYLLKGVNIIYQGQEIGMVNQHYKDISEIHDIESINAYKLYHKNLDMMKFINLKSRDHSRVPLLWDMSLNSGFSESESWTKSEPSIFNIENEKSDSQSILNFYKKLISLKHNNKIISEGKLINYKYRNDVVFYQREYNNIRVSVVVNFSESEKVYKHIDKNNILISNYDIDDKYRLRPYEIVCWREDEENSI